MSNDSTMMNDDSFDDETFFDDAPQRGKSIKREDFHKALTDTIGQENIYVREVRFDLHNYNDSKFWTTLANNVGITKEEMKERMPSLKNAKKLHFAALRAQTAYYNAEKVQAKFPNAVFDVVEYDGTSCIRGFELMNKTQLKFDAKHQSQWNQLYPFIVKAYNVPTLVSASKVGRVVMASSVAAEL